jgi:chemotaxis protein MotB
MKRRPVAPNPHAARVSGDRWLFGYADIVTLLLAVFASLYASGLTTAAEPPADPPAPEPVVEQPAPEPLDSAPEHLDIDEEPVEVPELVHLFEDLTDETAALPGIEMTTNSRGFVISLPEAGSFPAGSAELSPAAIAVMADLAERLRDVPNAIRVEGHTDDVPISTPQFASNWALSTARATRVVELLIDEGIDPGRLAVAGYAEHRPRLPNDSPSARARNRRVDIVVLDPVTAIGEDPQGAMP